MKFVISTHTCDYWKGFRPIVLATVRSQMCLQSAFKTPFNFSEVPKMVYDDSLEG